MSAQRMYVIQCDQCETIVGQGVSVAHARENARRNGSMALKHSRDVCRECRRDGIDES